MVYSVPNEKDLQDVITYLKTLPKVPENVPSDCRIASIVPNHAMILPHHANPKPDGTFGKDNYPR